MGDKAAQGEMNALAFERRAVIVNKGARKERNEDVIAQAFLRDAL
jgi:hypothetical protein